MLGIVSSCAIVTLSLRMMLQYSTSKNVVILKSSQRLLKVIESGTIRQIVYGFLLVFISNIVPKMHHFLDIRLQNCLYLENRVMGPSRSLEMLPCDSAHMASKKFLLTFYSNYGSPVSYRGYWDQWADERFGDPPPRWIQEPSVVRDSDGRPQEF